MLLNPNADFGFLDVELEPGRLPDGLAELEVALSYGEPDDDFTAAQTFRLPALQPMDAVDWAGVDVAFFGLPHGAAQPMAAAMPGGCVPASRTSRRTRSRAPGISATAPAGPSRRTRPRSGCWSRTTRSGTSGRC